MQVHSVAPTCNNAVRMVPWSIVTDRADSPSCLYGMVTAPSRPSHAASFRPVVARHPARVRWACPVSLLHTYVISDCGVSVYHASEICLYLHLTLRVFYLWLLLPSVQVEDHTLCPLSANFNILCSHDKYKLGDAYGLSFFLVYWLSYAIRSNLNNAQVLSPTLFSAVFSHGVHLQWASINNTKLFLLYATCKRSVPSVLNLSRLYCIH